jgi:hypothetical protein
MRDTPRRTAGRLSLDLQSVTETGAALSLSRWENQEARLFRLIDDGRGTSVNSPSRCIAAEGLHLEIVAQQKSPAAFPVFRGTCDLGTEGLSVETLNGKTKGN